VDYILWATPIKEGKTEQARKYTESLETSRRADYEASQEELKMQKEIFWILPKEVIGSDRDWMMLYMEAASMEEAFKIWDAHEGDFETYGKGQWAEWCDELPSPLWQRSGESPFVLEMLSYYQHPGHTY
jgi:hypothetical protein